MMGGFILANGQKVQAKDYINLLQDLVIDIQNELRLSFEERHISTQSSLYAWLKDSERII